MGRYRRRRQEFLHVHRREREEEDDVHPLPQRHGQERESLRDAPVAEARDGRRQVHAQQRSAPGALKIPSHQWHEMNSYGLFKTVALAVSSKSPTSRNAEAAWGAYKNANDDKMAGLDTDKKEKRSLIYENADRKQFVRPSTDDAMALWGEDDNAFALSSELEKFNVTIDLQPAARVFILAIENWESHMLKKKHKNNEAKLLLKYGGVCFEDDEEEDAHGKVRATACDGDHPETASCTAALSPTLANQVHDPQEEPALPVDRQDDEPRLPRLCRRAGRRAGGRRDAVHDQRCAHRHDPRHRARRVARPRGAHGPGRG